MDGMNELFALRADIEFLKTAFGNSIKVGPVEVMDAAKGYRLKLGDGPDGPFLSPWYPHPETGKTSVPLKKGQIVGVVNPTGDPRQGLLIRGGYSDANASPNNDLEANVFADAGVRMVVRDGGLVLEASKAVTLTIGANIRFVVPRFEVN
jgi:hypothetical protein